MTDGVLLFFPGRPRKKKGIRIASFSIGKREVFFIREMLFITQRELAIKCKVTVQTVSSWETGRTTPMNFKNLRLLKLLMEKARREAVQMGLVFGPEKLK